jgi:hypothetical protein
MANSKGRGKYTGGAALLVCSDWELKDKRSWNQGGEAKSGVMVRVKMKLGGRER